VGNGSILTCQHGDHIRGAMPHDSVSTFLVATSRVVGRRSRATEGVNHTPSTRLTSLQVFFICSDIMNQPLHLIR
jgi:hypothetical protein